MELPASIVSLSGLMAALGLAQWSSGPLESAWEILRGAFLFLIFFLGPVLVLSSIFYQVIRQPWRRREQARFFLDLIEGGLRAGRTPEETLVEAASVRDASPGVRFHLAAAQVEGGCRLEEALAKEPRLLPPQMTAMIQAGIRNVGLPRVLPACRALLKDGTSQGHSGMNWHPLLFFILSPIQIWLFFMLMIWVMPKIRMIMAEMVPGGELPGLFRWIVEWDWVWMGTLGLVYAVLLGTFLAMVGGPRLGVWLSRLTGGAWDRLVHALPWRRHRMHRDFANLLALFLDEGMPEDQAVTLAATASANRHFQNKAERVARALREGETLPEAIRHLDHRRELAWRLATSLRSSSPVHPALDGWCSALEAKAFQQEQAVTQGITTGLVLINGLIVGLVAVGLFSVLITILEGVVLW